MTAVSYQREVLMSDEARELLSMLGEKPADTPRLDDVDGEAVGAPKPKSATALILDRFNMRRGEEVLKESERMRQALGKDQDAKNLAADFHALAFEPDPLMAEDCENENLHTYVKALLENPKYQEVHSETMCDDMASEIAATGFSEQWIVYVKQMKEQEEKCQGKGQGKPDPNAAKRAANKAANNAVKQAQQDVDDMRDMQAGFGMDPGSNGGGNKDKIKQAFKRMKNNTRLRAVVDRAGRFRRFAQQRQRIKTKHGSDDMVGITLGGDVEKLLTDELTLLHDPLLELDLLRRMAEGEAMQTQWSGITTKARGPIVLWVDESGSMDGERIADAKAIALSMAWIAQHQKRWCYLVGFASTSEIRTCYLPPGKDNSMELMDWCDGFFGGGTDIPIEWTMANWKKMGAPHGKTDVVCITDGVTYVQEPTAKKFMAWKKQEQVSLTTIVVGESQIGALEAYSDKSFLAKSLGLEEDCVGDIMSI
jgi:uncharacterized protein with von Willebrand factor type A (vWA) domain